MKHHHQLRCRYAVLTLALLVSACESPTSITQDKQSEQLNERPYVASPVDYVNPLIGTKGPFDHRQAANVVPGAVVPHGMFNFGPEHSYTKELLAESERIQTKVVEQNKRVPVSPGGYNYDATRLKGFSLTRLSGTGCMGASGDVPIMPFTGKIKASPATDKMDSYYSAGFSHANETAIPGYYQVGLDNGVNTELAATTRSGIAKFTFADADGAKLLFRTAHSQLGSGEASTLVDSENGEVTGSVTSGNFCGYLGEFNQRDYYTLYFVAKIDGDIVGSGAWQDDKVEPNATSASGGMGYGDNGWPDLGKGSGVWVDLGLTDGQTVTVRVGISYVSLDNARENLAAEQANRDFADVKKLSQQAWNDELAQVKVVSDDAHQLTIFYTALYHSLFHPNVFSDVNGQYAGFDQQVHDIEDSQQAQYANFSGWDVYRSQLQLVSLVNEKRASDIAQSLFNQAQQYNGVWDRWTHNNGPTGVMSGDPSSIAIANFVAFGATDFNVIGAYDSLYSAAINPTALDLSDQGCPVFCRGQHPSLDQWQTLGYLSDQSNSWEGASETLEQASAYFALSQLANRVGTSSQEARMLKESGNWKNLFNPNATKEHGYIQGRNTDGSWKTDFDPYSPHLFVEGSPAQYLWMVPFDGAGLKNLLGTDEQVAERLDKHFKDENGEWVLYRNSAQYADVSNQPSILTPWMYTFAGKAHKTQETVRATMDKLWLNAPEGIPGQDDLGQMSSWYVFSALGIYPMYPGRADLVLSSPIFEYAKIGNLSISAPNASASNRYISKLTINGKDSRNSWINEDYIQQPTLLEFELAPEPNPVFGSASENRPPSYP